jgi:hypothetical protein
MRTTLDIDDDVLAAANELAKSRKTTAGEVISELARRALTASSELSGPPGPCGAVLQDGWYVLPRREGTLVTSELVQQLRDEADLEDAGLPRSG